MAQATISGRVLRSFLICPLHATLVLVLLARGQAVTGGDAEFPGLGALADRAISQAISTRDLDSGVLSKGGAPKQHKTGIKLTYFNIAAAAEKVRLALVLAGEDFDDERISFSDWQDLKPKTPFGQLPIMSIDGGRAFAQSEAMLREVGRRHPELYPAEAALCIDELLGLSGDLARAWMPSLYIGMKPDKFGYPANYTETEEGQAKKKQMRESFVAKELPTWLGHFSTWLKTKGGGRAGFMCGPRPTIADCALVPQLRAFTAGVVDHVPKTCLDTHPQVTAYIARFLELPRVKAWYEKQAAAAKAAP